MKKAIEVILASLLLFGCSGNTEPTAALPTTVTIPATEATTTTTTATTTTVETLGEAAGVWCELHPWSFFQVAESLGLISPTTLQLIEIDGTSAFWGSSDGYDVFTGKQKFATLPPDWYEYPGAVKDLQRSLAEHRDQVGKEEYAHACNIAFETR